LELTSQIDSKYLAAILFQELAYLACAQAQYHHAAKLFGKIDALRTEMNSPIPPCDRAEYETSVEKVRTELGDDLFGNLSSAGKILPLDQLSF
jgi:hypothetical protein